MTKRLEMCISDSLDRDLSRIEVSAGIDRAEILRRGLAVMKAFRAEKARGNDHLGFVSDPRKLDLEIVNVL